MNLHTPQDVHIPQLIVRPKRQTFAVVEVVYDISVARDNAISEVITLLTWTIGQNSNAAQETWKRQHRSAVNIRFKVLVKDPSELRVQKDSGQDDSKTPTEAHGSLNSSRPPSPPVEQVRGAVQGTGAGIISDARCEARRRRGRTGKGIWLEARATSGEAKSAPAV